MLAALMSAWQTAISSTRKAAMKGGVHPIGWAAPGRYRTEAGYWGIHESLHPRPRPPNTDRERKPE